MPKFRLSLIAFAIIAAATVIWASEADELRERAEQIRREALQHRERGHGDEARRLHMKAEELAAEAERVERKARGGEDQRRRRIAELERHLDELRLEERQIRERVGDVDHPPIRKIRERAEAVAKELGEFRTGQHHAHERERREHERHPHHHGDELARRLEHLRNAHKHLAEAGMDDLVKEVERHIEAMESQQRHRQEPHGEIAAVVDDLARQFDALRREVRELREQVEELKEEDDDDD